MLRTRTRGHPTCVEKAPVPCGIDRTPSGTLLEPASVVFAAHNSPHNLGGGLKVPDLEYDFVLEHFDHIFGRHPRCHPLRGPAAAQSSHPL